MKSDGVKCPWGRAGSAVLGTQRGMTGNTIVRHVLLELERAGWDSLCNQTGSEYYGELMLRLQGAPASLVRCRVPITAPTVVGSSRCISRRRSSTELLDAT